MKKIVFIVFISLLFVFISLTYILIPSKISIVTIQYAKCSLNAAERMVLYIPKWKAWWPQPVQKNDSFIFKNKIFKPELVSLNGMKVNIADNNITTKTELILLPLNDDSVQIEWRSNVITASKNPVTRIKQYRQASSTKNVMDSVLAHLCFFLSSTQNIYGMDISEVKVKDSLLITAKFTTSSFPGTEEVYSAVNKLKNYISQQGAKENNFPMMHVDKIDSSHYETMIAIPINKQLHETDNLKMKRMVLGNILKAEVKGGEYTVQHAMQQLENYRKDYGFQTPAIPFTLLVTNRSKESDTTKWITQLYYPVY
jgi:hypothetical protein